MIFFTFQRARKDIIGMWCVGVLNKPEIVVSHFLLPISNKHIHVHEENEERER